MKVGVVVGSLSPVDGGGHTVRESLVEAIKCASSRHSFVFIDAPGDSPGDGAGAIKSKSRRFRRAVATLPVLGTAARSLHARGRALLAAQPEMLPIERDLEAAGVDIVWFLQPGNPPLRTPYISTVWDLQHRLQPFFPEVSVKGWTWDQREQSYRAGLPRAARVITGTQAGKEEIMRFYGLPPETVRVIPLPVAKCASLAEIDARPSLREKYRIRRPFLFYPAQFWPHKNHVNLLIALDLLRRQHSFDLDLVLTGSDKGNRAHVERTVAQLRLEDRVHILGFVTRAELEKLYREAKALVFPSFFGPDNLPPLEAFALDCPVAAARVTGAAEQLGAAALLFDPADPAAIADAVKPLVDEDNVRRRMIASGREQVAARVPEHYAAAMCAILDEFEPFRRNWGNDYARL